MTAPAESIWTLAGDETSWSAWAEQLGLADASALMWDLVSSYKTPLQTWAIDIGCGTGRAFLPLVEAGYRVIGIDPTWMSIALCKKRIRHTSLCAYPTLASADRIPLPGASIDFVFALSSLFHLNLKELGSALQEIQRILRPGGKAVLHFLDLEDWRRTLAEPVHPDLAPASGYQAVVTCFCSPNQIQHWIAAAGLSLIALDLHTSLSEHGQQRNWIAHCTR